MERSKWLIIVMLLVAFTMAGSGVAYRYLYGRRALELWGAEHAGRLKNAEQVTLFRLSAGDSDGDEPLVDPAGKRWSLSKPHEIGQVADLLHIRRVFVQDAYFDWQAAEHPSADWLYALRFHDDLGNSTLLLDGSGSEICLLESPTQATIRPQVMPSLRRFMESHLK